MLRTFGYDLTSREVLSIDNVSEAHFTVPGQPNVTLNWGSHGPLKVFFWANAWQIPKDYALGKRHRPDRLHVDERQDGDPRLPDHGHPLISDQPPDTEERTP